MSVTDARARVAHLATEGVYADDKAFVHWVHDRWVGVGVYGMGLCARI